MPSCCVPGCKSKDSRESRLHRFPIADHRVYKIWVARIDNSKLFSLMPQDVYNKFRICDLHFDISCSSPGTRRLKVGSLPTRNLPGDEIYPSTNIKTSRFLWIFALLDSGMTPTCYHGQQIFLAALLDSASLKRFRALLDSAIRYMLSWIKTFLTVQLDSASQKIFIASRKKQLPSVSTMSPTPAMPMSHDISDSPIVEPLSSVSSFSEPLPSTSTFPWPLPSLSTSPQPYTPVTHNISNISQQVTPVSHCSSTLPENVTPVCRRSLSNRFSILKKINVTAEHQLTPKCHRLYNFVKRTRKIAKSLTTDNALLKEKLAMALEYSNTEQFLSSLKKPVGSFVRTQLQQSSKKPRGRRFDDETKLMCLSLLKNSNKGYKLLRKMFALPSRRTLVKLLQNIPFNVGINQHIMGHMKEAVRNLKELEKYCILMFDEVSLESGLTYDSKEDRIIGFEDLGGNANTRFADHAIVFMLRGLTKAWKQPIAYYFCESTTRSDQLCIILKQIIVSVQETGLKVVATVCDQGANNVGAINKLLKETDSACKRRGEENKYVGFTVNGEEIVPLYDPPHLLKGIRNNLLTSDVSFKWKKGTTQTASWDDIVLLYELDVGDDNTKMCNKLTDRHVLRPKIKKMKVSYAAQVFSQRVSSTLRGLVKHGKADVLPSSAEDTADFLLFMDLLFDSVNGTALKPKDGKLLRSAVNHASPHMAFWEEALKVLKTISFNSNKIKVPPSVKNWAITIYNIRYLWQKLSSCGFLSLRLGLLNQDPLENFFGSIRSMGYRNVNPTPYSFINSYKTLIINNFFTSHSVSSNCEEDFSEGALTNLGFFLQQKTEAKDLNDENPIELHIPFNSEIIPTTLAKFSYISGYVAKKIIKKIHCPNCRQNLISTEDREEHFLISARDYTGHSLMYPSSNFSILFAQIVYYFQNLMPIVANDKNILSRLCTYMVNNVTINLLNPCGEHNLKELFIRKCTFILLHSFTKKINQILSGKGCENYRVSQDFFESAGYKKFVKTKKKSLRALKL